jgi:hypothetical protein
VRLSRAGMFQEFFLYPYIDKENDKIETLDKEP